MTIRFIPDNGALAEGKQSEQPQQQPQGFLRPIQKMAQWGVETTLAFPKGIMARGIKTLTGLEDIGETIGEKIFNKSAPRYGLQAREASLAELEKPMFGQEEKPMTAKVLQKGGEVAGDVAQFLIPAGKIAKAEKAIELGIKGTEIAKVFPNAAKFSSLLAKTAIEGLTTAGIIGAQTGGDTEAMKVGGAIGAATPLVLKGLALPFQKLLSTRMKAGLSGLEPADINAIVNDLGLSKAEGAKYLKTAEEAVAKRGSVSPLKKYVTDDFNFVRKTITKNLNKVGEKIGAIYKKIKPSPEMNVVPKGTKVDVTFEPSATFKKTKDNFVNRLKDMDVNVLNNGKLDFTGSSIEGMSADENILSYAWSRLNAQDLPEKVISFTRNLGNKLYRGKLNKEFAMTESQGIIEGLRKSLKDEINTFAKGKGFKELEALNNEYHNLMELKDLLNKKSSGGKTAGSLLRRLFGNADEVPREVLNKIEEYAKKYGIKKGENLFNKANLALAAENAVKYVPKTSLKGSIPTTKAGLFSKVGEKIGEKFIGTAPENFLKIIEEEANKLVPKEQINSLLSAIKYRLFGGK